EIERWDQECTRLAKELQDRRLREAELLAEKRARFVAASKAFTSVLDATDPIPPNPARGSLNLSAPLPTDEHTELQVTPLPPHNSLDLFPPPSRASFDVRASHPPPRKSVSEPHPPPPTQQPPRLAPRLAPRPHRDLVRSRTGRCRSWDAADARAAARANGRREIGCAPGGEGILEAAERGRTACPALVSGGFGEISLLVSPPRDAAIRRPVFLIV
ncbi:hypothetical protein BDK51DRAFT_36905, partial [Blyttiomyces helicus]